ncbi:MAG: IgGFc-binding protein [Deltaproteobacteria bacterium]|nr:IgGFc-binding protein [Deltaproteobacteria bacterium]
MHRIVFATAVVLVTAFGCGSSVSPDATADGGAEQCVDGQTTCLASTFQRCEGGSWVDQEVCSQICDSTLGCVECVPGANFCDGNDVYSCNSDGSRGGFLETCEGELICSQGRCVDACQEAADGRSYIGCEYYAVDNDNAIEVLDVAGDDGCGGGGGIFNPGNPGAVQRDDLFVCHDPDATGLPPLFPPQFVQGLCDPDGGCPSGYACEQTPVCVLDAQNSPFAVVVSNPQESAVDVTISDAAGSAETFSLTPGEVRSILPQSLGFADHSIDGSGVSASAYKIVSTAPVVAYQFNPLDNVDVFSNDGSLLIARHAYDQKYYGMTWPTLERRSQGTHDYHGYITVVAWQDDTQVTVKPNAGVIAGPGIQALSAGQNATVTLNAMEVLQIQAVPDGDLTGSLVEAANGKTFGVFAGHEAIVIQNTEQSCCADHIEEMMFPASTWGKDFVIARSKDRGMNEPDLLRILAQKGGTTVTFDPTPIEGSCGTLNEGQFCDVRVQVDTQITASEPVLIGHYLLSVLESNGFTAEGIGDPSLALAVPYEQYRSAYDFLVPSEYDEQYVSVVAQQGAEVKLDGASVSSQLAPVAGGAFVAGRIKVEPGQHKLECPSSSCGIEIYGYSDAVSYLFAGGLDLQQIVIE